MKSETLNRYVITVWGYGAVLLGLIQVFKISSEASTQEDQDCVVNPAPPDVSMSSVSAANATKNGHLSEDPVQIFTCLGLSRATLLCSIAPLFF